MYKKKEFNKEEWAKQQEEKKQESIEKVQDILKNFKENPEKMLEYMQFRARFYNYSINNSLLIYMQNPNAYFVGSFPYFKKLGEELAKENKYANEHGVLPYFGVKKGEKGITILVPETVTMLKDGDEWVQLSKADARLKAAYKSGSIESRTKTVFGLGNVFDISQTALPQELYPAYIRDLFGTADERYARAVREITDYCTAKEINLDIEDLKSVSLSGYASGEGKTIAINERLNDTRQLSTLCHEVGHCLMHFSTDAGKMSPAQKEVEADLFSALMLGHYGFPVDEARKRHLVDNFQSISEENKAAFEETLKKVSEVYSDAVKDMQEVIEQEQTQDKELDEGFNMEMSM